MFRASGDRTGGGSPITGTTITATTKFLAADGTASAPGYGFTSESNTGFYRSSANVVAASVGGGIQWSFGGTYLQLHPSGDLHWGTSTALDAGTLYIKRYAAKQVSITGDGTGATTNAGWILGYEGTNSGYSALWSSTIAPSIANYSVRVSSGDTSINGPGGSGTVTLDVNNGIIATVSSTGLTMAAGKTLVAAAGSGTGTYNAAGAVNVQTAAAGIGNGADATDDTLFTYSLPLNSLDGNGKAVRVRAWGTSAANANNKDIKLWFAGVTIIDSGVIALNASKWSIEMTIIRIDATHVSTVGSWNDNGLTTADVASLPNQAVADLTANASVIKVTGASPTISAASDVLGYGMMVEFLN